MRDVVTSLFIADHHDDFRQLVLAYVGHNPEIELVGEASEWAQLEAQLPVAKPQILLVEPELPGLQFDQMVELVLEKCPGTQIIVFSLHANGKLAAGYLSAGARGYLLKDCMHEELGCSVQAVNAGKLYVSPSVGSHSLSCKKPSRPG